MPFLVHTSLVCSRRQASNFKQITAFFCKLHFLYVLTVQNKLSSLDKHASDKSINIALFIEWIVMASKTKCCIYSFLHLSVSWAWWDWPLTWLTNRCPSLLWNCCLGRLTGKTIPEITLLTDIKPSPQYTCIGCSRKNHTKFNAPNLATMRVMWLSPECSEIKWYRKGHTCNTAIKCFV